MRDLDRDRGSPRHCACSRRSEQDLRRVILSPRKTDKSLMCSISRALISIAFLLASLQAQAVNDGFVTFWNGLKDGHFCYGKSPSPIRWKEPDCPSPKNKAGTPEAGAKPMSRVFQQVVLEESAKLQILKNNCLIEQLKAFQKPEHQAAFDTWSMRVMHNWMGQKKMNQILQYCSHIQYEFFADDFGGLSKADFTNRFVAPAWRSSLQDPGFINKWKPYCTNSKLMAQIQEAVGLFPAGVPVISSQMPLSEMEIFRGNIQNLKTGKPISDQDILDVDLRKDSGQFALTNVDGFQNKMKARFSKLITEKEKVNKQLAAYLESSTAQKKDFQYMLKDESSLDEGLQDYLFDEGTILDTLATHRALADGTDDFDRASVCMIGSYEHSFTGEVIEMVGSGGGAAGAIYKLTKGAVTGARVAMTAMNAGKKSLAAGFAITSIGPTLSQIKLQCLGQGTADTRAIRKGKIKADSSPDAVLPTTNFKLRPSGIPRSEAPSCAQLPSRDFLLRGGGSCIQETLFNILPMEISLPLILSK